MKKTVRLTFVTYLELIKKSLSGNNSNTAVGNEILYSYREMFKTDPEDDSDVLGFSRSAIACWLKGKRKLDTKIRKFYLVNGQKHALYDVEYMRDELKSFYAFSEELYHIAVADTTIPEDIKKELLSAWGYEDEKRCRFVAAVQLYVLDLADDNDVEEDTEEKELIAFVMAVLFSCMVKAFLIAQKVDVNSVTMLLVIMAVYTVLRSIKVIKNMKFSRWRKKNKNE